MFNLIKSDRKIITGLIIIVIIILISTFLLVDLYLDYYYLTHGKEERTEFVSSHYTLYIISNSSIPQSEIKIPFSSETQEIGDFHYYYGSFVYENTTYGYTIKIVTELINSKEFFWIQNEPIAMKNFSTVEENNIWIYMNNTNNSGSISFLLLKEDIWNTKALLYSQIDYSGVMKNPFPNEFGTYREHDEYIYNNTVELKMGWHKYPLLNGTYWQYAD